jgi:glucokinase
MYLWLRKENKNVSAEEVISGRGLVNIYRFLKEKENLPNMNDGGNPLSAEAIGEAALKGNEVCMKAVKLMFGILGTVAANGVLTNGSWGGVIIAGGITPKLIDLFKASPFQENFSSHEVYRKLLERVSVYIFSDPLGGLKGAQIAFSKMLEE